jgi:quinoprotein glucose dehydrogenase
MWMVYSSLMLSCTRATPSGEWRFYASDAASTKFSSLEQIDATNVGGLRVAWRWVSIDENLRANDAALWTWKNEATPLMAGRTLYVSTSLSQVAALDPVSGRTKWIYDPETYKAGSPPGGGFVHRGLALWEDTADRRIIIATGDAYLIALDAATGTPVRNFGDRGRVDLTGGLRRPVDRAFYGVTSPPAICRNTIVVGSSILDIDGSWTMPLPERMPPGDVRGYDVRTGALRWRFESVPQGNAPGSETWQQGSWKDVGDTNVWSLMSCDETLGYVYLPFGTATNDYYGGRRPGDNLFAESLVALNAESGRRVWHFQAVRHGLWDYDLPAAPNLVNITVDGRFIKAVAQVSKQGFVYVLDRVDGTPVWPIENRAVPTSHVHSEQASPVQPFPTRPPPFDRQGLTPQDLIDFTPELRDAALAIVSQYDHGALFTPPSERGTIAIPGALGGASWAGAAVDPRRGILYVTSVTDPAILTVRKSGHASDDYPLTGVLRFGPDGPLDLPLVKPPYGRITAIDLNTGNHLWMRPIGDGPRNHRAVRHLQLPELGWPFRSFALLTSSLLFVAQEGPVIRVRGVSPRGNAIELETGVLDPALLALNPHDGKVVAKITLPGNATGAPMTYSVDGKQYIVVPVGGASQRAELVAVSLR